MTQPTQEPTNPAPTPEPQPKPGDGDTGADKGAAPQE